MTRAEQKLLFPSLTPSHPFLLSQSYIFEKNFYLFSPPPVTCGVSPFATTEKAPGFPFYSNTDSSDDHVPGVALNGCVQQLFSAKAKSGFVLFFFYQIQNKKQQTVRFDFSCFQGRPRLAGSGGCCGWESRAPCLPVWGRGPQGTREIKQGMGQEWDKKHSQSWVEIQLSKCLQRFFFIPFLLRFIYF